MIYLNIIGLFLKYNFHLFLTALYSSGGEKNVGFLLFELVLHVFSPSFSGVFLNIIRYGKRIEILCYLVSKSK